MVCTANYVAKAEERKGGAGYESIIVTGHVARATDTIKFAPIVRDNAGESLVPGFLGQRKWLDFRDDGLFDERLEELLRELHGALRYPKPPLGRNPFAGSELEAGAKDQESPAAAAGAARGRGAAGRRLTVGRRPVPSRRRVSSRGTRYPPPPLLRGTRLPSSLRLQRPPFRSLRRLPQPSPHSRLRVYILVSLHIQS
jgi:hypothetical protein